MLFIPFIYFSVKQLIGGTQEITETVSNVVEEVAKTTNLTEAINDVDQTKIIELSSYISETIETTVENLEKKNLILYLFTLLFAIKFIIICGLA